MRLKKAKKNKTESVGVRCKQDEYNALQRKANIYTDGNLSEYVLFAALNFVPSKEDFELEEKEGEKWKI